MGDVWAARYEGTRVLSYSNCFRDPLTPAAGPSSSNAQEIQCIIKTVSATCTLDTTLILGQINIDIEK